MNDTEIIKVFERCRTNDILKEHCEVCSYKAKGLQCMDILLKDINDIINRQKAEIERLNGCVKSEDEVRKIIKSQMEPMVQKLMKEQIDKAFHIGKIDGALDFAEVLIATLVQENELYESCASRMLPEDFQRGYEAKNDSVINHIRYIVEEMVGENNE